MSPSHSVWSTRWQQCALLALLLLAGGADAACAAGPVAAGLRDQLTLETAVEAGDRDALRRLYAATDRSGAARGRALAALWSGDKLPSGAARAQLLEALRDPAPEVRAAAARVVGATQERPLEREVLHLVAEDPDPRTRVAALRAVRPWTRQGHLYFLEEALNSQWPTVQGEALVNLGGLSYRELPPEVSSRVAALAGPDAPPAVRRRALDTLAAWGRLTWPVAQAVVADPAAPCALRLNALERSAGLPAAEGRGELLRELLETVTSLPLAWAAFQELSRDSQGAAALDDSLRHYLLRTAERNTATEAMAAYLGHAGYRVDYRAGAWQIGSR